MPKRKELKPADERGELMERLRGQRASDADRAAFRLILRQDTDKWRQTVNMITIARRDLVERMNANAMSKELTHHSCEELRQQLAQPEDGQLEKMLIDVAVFAWLRLSLVEQEYTGKWHSAGGISIASGIFWEKRLNGAHKRFEKACLNLARVRKLLRPKVTNQLSVGTLNALVSGNEIAAVTAAAVDGLRKSKRELAMQTTT